MSIEIKEEQITSLIDIQIKEMFFEQGVFKFLETKKQEFYIDINSVNTSTELKLNKKFVNINGFRIYSFPGNSTKFLSAGNIILNKETGSVAIFYSVTVGRVDFESVVTSDNFENFKNVVFKCRKELLKIQHSLTLRNRLSSFLYVENIHKNYYFLVDNFFYGSRIFSINSILFLISVASVIEITKYEKEISNFFTEFADFNLIFNSINSIIYWGSENLFRSKNCEEIKKILIGEISISFQKQYNNEDIFYFDYEETIPAIEKIVENLLDSFFKENNPEENPYYRKSGTFYKLFKNLIDSYHPAL